MSGPEPVLLPPADWSEREGLKAVLSALDPQGEGLCRYVGGAVRDTLLGMAVKDVDIATPLLPEQTMERLKNAGIRVVPTGIDHGTVTAIPDDGPVEITTLRADVSTDGRRATVRFSEDWREDAARRDFTINALYADPVTRQITDYFGGLGDLADRHLRFIGDATQRIREDHLRIMRFFRFHARFGSPDPDPEAFAACRDQAPSLKALSRERISSELLLLLGMANPLPAARLMAECGVWPHVLPEMTGDALDRLARLLGREEQKASPADVTLRLASIVPRNPEEATRIGARLRFSRARTRMLELLLAEPSPDPDNVREIAYRHGREAALGRTLLFTPDASLDRTFDIASRWTERRFALNGRDVIAHGLPPGPMISKALVRIEQQWIDEGFPDDDRLSEICRTIALGMKS
ncbi:MAG: CCA tRNA nucleotidyltransferase [Blastomonas sp.]